MTKACEEFKSTCAEHKEYFEKCDDDISKRIHTFFESIIHRLNELAKKRSQIEIDIEVYDYDENTPANGYRSFILVENHLINEFAQTVKHIRRNKMINYLEDIENTLCSFINLYDVLICIKSASKPSELFVFNIDDCLQILSRIDEIDVRHFIGKFLGFQYQSDLRSILILLNVLCSAYSLVYYGNESSLQEILKHDTIITDYYERSNELQKVYNYRAATVYFWRSFWKWTFISMLESCTNSDTPEIINLLINISPVKIVYKRRDGSTVKIPIPTAHIGIADIQARLISSIKRIGMTLETDKGFNEPADDLIFHIHGGGFVSQSSIKHLPYLVDWTTKTGIPIISVDYSLAPEAPYPRAVEEIFYAYVWCLQNSALLGSKVKRVILAGDSAGANLCVSLTLKCIELNVRKPDGMLLAYAPVIISGCPSPARMLSLIDTVLSFSSLVGCIKAYTKNFVTNDDANTIMYKTFNVEHGRLQTSVSSVTPDDALKNETRRANSKSRINYEDLTCELDIPPLHKRILENFLKYILPVEKIDNTSCDKILWTADVENNIAKFESIPLEVFIRKIPNDMFLSPYFITEDLLKQLPPVTIVSLHLDACLDDCVMFARKLRNAGNPVTFEVLDKLPHGFLNLYHLLSDARLGSDFILQKICDLFERAAILKTKVR